MCMEKRYLTFVRSCEMDPTKTSIRAGDIVRAHRNVKKNFSHNAELNKEGVLANKCKFSWLDSFNGIYFYPLLQPNLP